MRQYLGAARLDAKRAAEAETIFREDLGHEHTPQNGWSLYGLELALRAKGKPRRLMMCIASSSGPGRWRTWS